MPVQTQMQVRRGTASSWTSTNPTLAAGELGFETNTGKFKIGNGSSTWTSLLYAGGGQSSLTTYQYTATAGQTTFSGADINSNTLAYTVGAIQVYLNGALLQNTVDFAASTGTSVVLTGGAGLGDSLTIISFATFDVANTIPVSAFTAKGQILAATGSGAYTAQAVGANGTVLTANSAQADGVEWVAPSSGGMTLLSTTTLSGATVTISSINQTYTSLLILLRDVVTGINNENTYLELNSDSTNHNYANIGVKVDGSGATRIAKLNGILLNLTSASGANPNMKAQTTFQLYNYASTATRQYEYTSSVRDGNGNQQAIIAGGLYVGSSAVTSLRFYNDSSSFTNGSVLIYGVK